MNKILPATILLSLCLVTARADQAPTKPDAPAAQPAQTVAAPAATAVKTPLPSHDSVKRLVDDLGLKKNFDAFYAQVNSMIGMQLTRATMGIPPSPETKAAVEAAKAKMLAKIQTNLSWDKLEESYIGEFSNNFTQAEIDSLLSFYESPLGKSFAAKEPAIMQGSNHKIHDLIQPVMSGIMMDVEKTGAELRAKNKTVGATGPAPGTPPALPKPPVVPAAPVSAASHPAP
ncbi:MAG: DUF2059 domain-containing protein [Opitutaceae bacterium]